MLLLVLKHEEFRKLCSESYDYLSRESKEDAEIVSLASTLLSLVPALVASINDAIGEKDHTILESKRLLKSNDNEMIKQLSSNVPYREIKDFVHSIAQQFGEGRDTSKLSDEEFQRFVSRIPNFSFLRVVSKNLLKKLSKLR